MPKQNGNVLSLNLANSNGNQANSLTSQRSPDTLSPMTPSSPRSTPTSPFPRTSTIRPVTSRSAFQPENSFQTPISPTSTENTGGPLTQSITAIPPYPPSPKESSKHGRDPSRSFFANLKASKSSHRIQSSDGQSSNGKSVSRESSKERSVYTARSHGSTPDLPSSSGLTEQGTSASEEEKVPLRLNQRQPTDLQLPVSKKNKPRFANILSRTRSIRVDDSTSSRSHNPHRRPSTGLLRLEEVSNQETQLPLKTAPLQQERAFKDAMNSSQRNHSADRHDGNHGAHKKDRSGPSMTASYSLSQVSGVSLNMLSNLKQSSSDAANRFGKSSKGFFGKIARSGSTNERELVTDDAYVCSTINLPLVEQTRRTRISKRLEDSKDKTEYWMPALPWRCIDYLNFKGCEEEGLYRVPGSGKEVKHWQRRFDSELDINLFDEPELYDINTIGSMFKAWLRELPDEIFPKATQAMIAEKCAGATTAPQLLKDELSKLPPFNYYLLFAITCHLSLLHSYVDQNKMDYRNLCICFQPCMKIDGFCFQFLVCDWKNCWQGCWTEKEYLQIELEAKAAKEAQNKPGSQAGSIDERAISSSGSSQPSQVQGPRIQAPVERPSQAPAPAPAPGPTQGSKSASGDADRGDRGDRGDSPPRGKRPVPKRLESTHKRSVSQLPELGPPLSPIQI